MVTTEMTIKLVFDNKSNKLIFAQASKDFVDFLFFLLSLPIGTAIKLITNESMVGSIGNIYTSIANLDKKCLQPNMHKKTPLNPMVFSYATDIPLSITESSIISSGKLYTCEKRNCSGIITNRYDAVRCPSCNRTMTREFNFVAASDTDDTGYLCTHNEEFEGYVKAFDSYIVSDDLSVTLMSSIVSMINKCSSSNIEEKEVKVGIKEGLELLKTSFRSTTVLTDVFLGTKKVESKG